MNLNLIGNFLIGRAGQRPRSGKPTLICIHGQEDVGNPHSYFASVAADSTCWIARDGHIERYLLDTDIAWTEGDVAEPMNHANPVIQHYLDAGVTNFNDLCLSVELEGWNSEASAAAHKQVDGTPYPPAFAHTTPVQYQALLALCVYWCQAWNIPADRTHIIGHYEVGEHKNCPGSMVDLDRLAQDAGALYQRMRVPHPAGVDGNFFILNAVGSYVCTRPPNYEINDTGGILTAYKARGGVVGIGQPTSPAFVSQTLAGRIVQVFDGGILVSDMRQSDPQWRVTQLAPFDSTTLAPSPTYSKVLNDALAARKPPR